MEKETKRRDSWSEEESSRESIRQSSPLKLSRVFRFIDQQTGGSQISDFPDSNPPGDTPLEIRMKHFTEIENFTFLAYTLAHELGGTTPRPIRTVTDLQGPDEECKSVLNAQKPSTIPGAQEA